MKEHELLVKISNERPYDSAIPHPGYSQRTETRDSSRYLCSDVHGSVIYNNKKWK